MISRLYQSIASGLKQVREYPVYMEDVPQGFKKPSFLIQLYEQHPSKGINGRLKNTVKTDVLYFPEEGEERKKECLTVGQDMVRSFRIPDFKMRNCEMKIEDDILHFLCDVDYREYLKDTSDKMQRILQNTKIKEN